jgi:hypothetical protein
VGAIAGLGSVAAAVGPFLLLGIVDTESFGGQALLILSVFAAQVVAGVLAARVAGRRRALNGGLAGLAVFAVVSGISIGAGGDPGVGALAFGTVVAGILGIAGGVLAEAAPRRPGGGTDGRPLPFSE